MTDRAKCQSIRVLTKTLFDRDALRHGLAEVLALLPVFSWADAFDLEESTIEIREIVETGLKGHFRDPGI